jgi:hypothetical protein
VFSHALLVRRMLGTIVVVWDSKHGGDVDYAMNTVHVPSADLSWVNSTLGATPPPLPTHLPQTLSLPLIATPHVATCCFQMAYELPMSAQSIAKLCLARTHWNGSDAPPLICHVELYEENHYNVRPPFPPQLPPRQHRTINTLSPTPMPQVTSGPRHRTPKPQAPHP